MGMEYKIKLLNDDPGLGKVHWEIVKTIYPPILLHSPVANKYWNKLVEYFPDHQIFIIDENNNVIGFANTIPFFWNKALKKLPDTGWDWLLEKGILDHEKGVKPNNLGGLQVGIAKHYQGKGFSKIIIKEVLKLAKENKYDNFIIPIRPTYKHKYPLISMKKYIKWKKDDIIFDPWLRTHVAGGARIIKICKKSMTYGGSLEEWAEKSGISIVGSGKYIVEGALQPVKIDVKKNTGVYYDPNIWIYYKL
jgi:GNAT superfamily N-acetyltransferase